MTIDPGITFSNTFRGRKVDSSCFWLCSESSIARSDNSGETFRQSTKSKAIQFLLNSNPSLEQKLSSCSWKGKWRRHVCNAICVLQCLRFTHVHFSINLQSCAVQNAFLVKAFFSLALFLWLLFLLQRTALAWTNHLTSVNLKTIFHHCAARFAAIRSRFFFVSIYLLRSQFCVNGNCQLWIWNSHKALIQTGKWASICKRRFCWTDWPCHLSLQFPPSANLTGLAFKCLSFPACPWGGGKQSGLQGETGQSTCTWYPDSVSLCRFMHHDSGLISGE